MQKSDVNSGERYENLPVDAKMVGCLYSLHINGDIEELLPCPTFTTGL